MWNAIVLSGVITVIVVMIGFHDIGTHMNWSHLTPDQAMAVSMALTGLAVTTFVVTFLIIIVVHTVATLILAVIRRAWMAGRR